MSTFNRVYIKGKNKLTTTHKITLPTRQDEFLRRVDVYPNQLDIIAYIEDAIAAGATTIGLIFPGPYDDDADAASNSIAVGTAYELAAGNTYGLPEGTIKVRRV